MAYKLLIFNPSDYSRGGYVTTPWQPIYKQTHISPESLVLYDKSGVYLTSQVDRVDIDDPSRDTLIFLLNQEIPPGSEDCSFDSGFINSERGKSIKPKESEPRIELIGKQNNVHAVKLFNSKLSVYFNLTPSAKSETSEGKHGGQNWHAGSATSVIVDKLEILDAFRSVLGGWIGHDPEKRCMQVDKLQLLRPPWETTLFQSVYLFDQPYQFITQSTGPLRASITIASKPFDYSFSDYVTRRKHLLKCQLYRVISLYAGVNYLTEELFVKGVSEGMNNTEIVNLSFVARFFAYMDMGKNPEIYSFNNVPDWFAVGYPHFSPYQGYGFATDVHANMIAHPHPDFPVLSEAYKSFSWQLYPCRSANCLHLFMCKQLNGFDDRIGHYWYDIIYKPLKAKFFHNGD